MIRKTINVLCDGTALVLGFLFTLAAAPIIHFSEADKVDCGPTPEDIERSRCLSESLKRERTK